MAPGRESHDARQRALTSGAHDSSVLSTCQTPAPQSDMPTPRRVAEQRPLNGSMSASSSCRSSIPQHEAARNAPRHLHSSLAAQGLSRSHNERAAVSFAGVRGERIWKNGLKIAPREIRGDHGRRPSPLFQCRPKSAAVIACQGESKGGGEDRHQHRECLKPENRQGALAVGRLQFAALGENIAGDRVGRQSNEMAATTGPRNRAEAKIASGIKLSCTESCNRRQGKSHLHRLQAAEFQLDGR